MTEIETKDDGWEWAIVEIFDPGGSMTLTGWRLVLAVVASIALFSPIAYFGWKIILAGGFQ
jgi:hypothetical protein